MRKETQYDKTDLKLFASFHTLLDQQRIDKDISVDLICQIAKIHRQTFYHHFDTKNDFYDAFFRKERIFLFGFLCETDQQKRFSLFVSLIEKHLLYFHNILAHPDLSVSFHHCFESVFHPNEEDTPYSLDSAFFFGGMAHVLTHVYQEGISVKKLHDFLIRNQPVLTLLFLTNENHFNDKKG